MGIDFAGMASRVQNQIGIFGDTITYEGGNTFRSIVCTNVESVPNFARDAFLKAGSEGRPAVFLMRPTDRPLIPSGAVLHRLNEEWTMNGPPILESFSDVPFQVGQVCLLSVTADLVAQPLNQSARILQASTQKVKGRPRTTFTPIGDVLPCRVETPTNQRESMTANKVVATVAAEIALPLGTEISTADRIAVGDAAELATGDLTNTDIYRVIGTSEGEADSRTLLVDAVRLEG